MDNLFEKRRALEVKFMDARQERMEENAQQVWGWFCDVV